jgi:hypothetical protein
MQALELEHVYQGTVPVQLCFPCSGVWFDHLGSIQLAPAAVITLFQQIQPHLADQRRPLAERLDCPRCKDALALGYDLCKSGRFSYFRCASGHGRFTPFLQFLREKQFVRNLSAAEIERVRGQVRQVLCTECGAPIDLAQDHACRYCHAPVSFLDPQAVTTALQQWSAADQRRRLQPSPEVLAQALLGTPAAGAPLAAPASRSGALVTGGLELAGDTVVVMDLVALGIRALGHFLVESGD